MQNLSSAQNFRKLRYFDFSLSKLVFMANSLDPDEMLHFAESPLDPKCLQRSSWLVSNTVKFKPMHEAFMN